MWKRRKDGEGEGWLFVRREGTYQRWQEWPRAVDPFGGYCEKPQIPRIHSTWDLRCSDASQGQ